MQLKDSFDFIFLDVLNISVNEKIYIFLWFWLLLLACLSTLVVAYRLVIVLSPRMRAYLLYIRWDLRGVRFETFPTYILFRFRLIKREVVNTLVKKSKVKIISRFYFSINQYNCVILHRWAIGFYSICWDRMWTAWSSKRSVSTLAFRYQSTNRIYWRWCMS